MMYNLSNLSAEEIKILQDELTNYAQAEQPVEEHGDMEADLAMLEPFAKVLDILIDKVEELEERSIKTEKLVVDDLFGGIQKMYSSNQRSQSIDGLRGKYGEMFDPFSDGLKELAPDEDIYEVLHDLIEPMKSDEGYNDEMEYGAVKNAADSIAAKIAALKGTDLPSEEGEIEVTEITVDEDEVKPSKEDAFLEKVKDMKKKATEKGL